MKPIKYKLFIEKL